VKKRQKSKDLEGFFFRIPRTLKGRIDDLAQKKGQSKAQVVVDLITAALDGDVVHDPDVSVWLKRVSNDK
jgi:predicted DNA-binding protein